MNQMNNKKYNEILEIKDKFPAVSWKEIEEVGKKYQFQLNSYLINRISEVNDPIWKQFIPHREELKEGGVCDPLAEQSNSPLVGLVHRYPNRVLLLLTDNCFARCRFCTRKRIFKEGYQSDLDNSRQVSRQKLVRETIEYIRSHPEINDLLISGGDPLTLADEELSTYLDQFGELEQLDLIRIGTRALSLFPDRITDKLVAVLQNRERFYINCHFNHVKELSGATKRATAKLTVAGIPLGCQTVLLKGVNDNASDLQELFYALLRIKVRPYYLHLMDLTEGTEHFRVSLDRAKEIYFNLSGRISGMALPKMVIDLPGGGGKIPLVPEYMVEDKRNEFVFRNFNNELFSYKKVDK